eukprot:6204910-Pleurochrysis_carterae.AAC.4
MVREVRYAWNEKNSHADTGQCEFCSRFLKREKLARAVFVRNSECLDASCFGSIALGCDFFLAACTAGRAAAAAGRAFFGGGALCWRAV